MRLSLILCFLYSVAAQSPVYSRAFLRDLKRVEIEKVQTESIALGIKYIEDTVLGAAKRGLLEYTFEPLEDCDLYLGEVHDLPIVFTKEICENIVSGIRTLAYQRFPDSDIAYNKKTKRYRMKWD
jgi:hypothetical protein